MNISWIRFLGAVPGVKKSVDALVAPGASKSNTVWYQLLKALITLASACGIYVTLSTEDIETISTLLAVGVPAILTLFDVVASLWIRIRTTQSLQDLKDNPQVK
jgi:hypothetical protein